MPFDLILGVYKIIKLILFAFSLFSFSPSSIVFLLLFHSKELELLTNDRIVEMVFWLNSLLERERDGEKVNQGIIRAPIHDQSLMWILVLINVKMHNWNNSDPMILMMIRPPFRSLSLQFLLLRLMGKSNSEMPTEKHLISSVVISLELKTHSLSINIDASDVPIVAVIVRGIHQWICDAGLDLAISFSISQDLRVLRSRSRGRGLLYWIGCNNATHRVVGSNWSWVACFPS